MKETLNINSKSFVASGPSESGWKALRVEPGRVGGISGNRHEASDRKVVKKGERPTEEIRRAG